MREIELSGPRGLLRGPESSKSCTFSRAGRLKARKVGILVAPAHRASPSVAGRPLPGGVAAFENSIQQATPPYFQLAFSAAPRAWRLSVPPPPLANGKVFRRKGPFCVLERERSPGLCPVVSGLHTYRASPRPWACASSSAAIRRHRALPSATRPCYLFHRRVKPLLRTCWKIVRLRTRLPKIHSDFRGGKLPDFRRLKNPVLRMPTGDFAVFPPRWKTTNTPYPWIFEAKKTQYMVAK